MVIFENIGNQNETIKAGTHLRAESFVYGSQTKYWYVYVDRVHEPYANDL